MKITISLLLIFLVSITQGSRSANSINDWKLIDTKNGIEVYTRGVEDSNLRELQLVFEFEDTRLSEIVSAFNDKAYYVNWVYRCTDALLLDSVNEHESFAYFTYDFPWPLTNRESITSTTILQDPISHTVTMETRHADEHKNAPGRSGMVRIPEVHNIWSLTPAENGKIAANYYLKTRPGGSIPTWAVNMVIDQGALKTVQNLREVLSTGKYKHKKIDWLIE